MPDSLHNKLSAHNGFVSTIAIVCVLLCFSGQANAQTGPANNVVRVAVADCPPFVFSDNGTYSGLAIYLWEQVGQAIGLTWEYTEYPLGEMLAAIGRGKNQRGADIGISCISVTEEREKLIDFSHSFTETHTAIAVRQTGLWSTITGILTNPRVLRAIIIVLGAAAVIGFIFYVLERQINEKLYSTDSRFGRFLEGLIVGLLFVTRGPIRFYEFKTLTARVLSAILAIGSTFLIAGITAVLASAFTINSFQSQVRDLGDLKRMRVGALEASTSSDFLDQNGVVHKNRPDLDTLVNDLDTGTFDAIVSDAAFLHYRVQSGRENGRFESLSVLPHELEAQNYAFVLDLNSPHREAINRALLAVRKRPEWRNKVNAYLGK